MPPSEFLLGLPVKRFCLNPAVEPRHLIGLLQQRLWSVKTRPPENLIPDSTQEDGKQQTGSNAKGGGGDSHSARSLWPLYCHITAGESTGIAINH
jgi:hypothetical protein